jgi:hypothetical protein
MSTVACCCTSSRISGSEAFWKPAACTVREYLAAGKVGKTYRPAGSLTVENWTFRSVSVTVILAFGTADFVESVTVPRIEPVYDWAHERAENKQTEASKLRTIAPFFRCFPES